MTTMSTPKKILSALFLAQLKMAFAQSYDVLPVNTERAAYGWTTKCSTINYSGTAACAERVPATGAVRITFDNPFYKAPPGIRALPSIGGLSNVGVNLSQINTGNIVTGYLNHADDGIRPLIAANGSLLEIANPPGSWAISINDQGWMLFNGDLSNRTSYLRVTNNAYFTAGTDYRISCPDGTPASAFKINRQGWIGGKCNMHGNDRAVIWPWWDLSNPIDLTALLPGFSDAMTDARRLVGVQCKVSDMADRAAIFMIECTGGSIGYRVFVNSPTYAGFRDLAERFSPRGPRINWTAVNEQGCAVGHIGVAWEDYWGTLSDAFVDCNGLPLSLRTATGDTISTALDINGQGHILAYSHSMYRYVVLAPRP